MRLHHRFRPRPAFTLVEILVAATLLGGAVVAAALCLEVAARADRVAGDAATLERLARDRTERLRMSACAFAATAGALDSADVHLAWQTRRADAVAYVRTTGHRRSSARVADSAFAASSVWCAA